jgi:hypothetical protein
MVFYTIIFTKIYIFVVGYVNCITHTIKIVNVQQNIILRTTESEMINKS